MEQHCTICKLQTCPRRQVTQAGGYSSLPAGCAMTIYRSGQERLGLRRCASNRKTPKLAPSWTQSFFIAQSAGMPLLHAYKAADGCPSPDLCGAGEESHAKSVLQTGHSKKRLPSFGHVLTTSAWVAQDTPGTRDLGMLKAQCCRVASLNVDKTVAVRRCRR